MPTTDELLASRLARHVGASRADEHVTECLTEAQALIDHHIGKRDIPKPVLERAIIECGADLFWRRQARNGIAAFESDGELGAVRINRDPLLSVRALLAPYLGVGIA